MEKKPLDFESSFNINNVSFDHVSKDFEHKFRESYKNSLQMMSDQHDPITNANGANTLGILEKMAQRIDAYTGHSDFEESYYKLLKEYEPFTET
ncbi:MAG: hypothetical protein N2645_03180 [Clostridia bacterium]|nr:hypothetical protein [Clostridia bacterium]